MACAARLVVRASLPSNAAAAVNFDGDRFDLDMVDKVEPQLPRNTPVILADYPAEAAALARRKPGLPNLAERWELFIGGMELANAYSELNDPAESARVLRSAPGGGRIWESRCIPWTKNFLL